MHRGVIPFIDFLHMGAMLPDFVVEVVTTARSLVYSYLCSVMESTEVHQHCNISA